ncbi:hypothetical protein TNCV_1277911 [Trichonephila clavipes]|nr:hypothetical protein TNCV_1277911 [Trichonephila clavipes]
MLSEVPEDLQEVVYGLQLIGQACPTYSLLYSCENDAQSIRLMFSNWRHSFTMFARTVTAGSDVVQSGRPIFDDFFQHLWPYIGNNTTNVVFQMIKRLWLIRIDQ